MGKILKLIFKIFLILFAIIGLGIVGIGWWGMQGNKEAATIADQWLPSIVAEWNADRLAEHMDTNGALIIIDAQGKEMVYGGAGKDIKVIRQVFDYARNTFGNMKNYGGAKCRGPNLAANCTSTITFEHGSAQILLTLKKQGDENKIIGFSIMDSASLRKSGK